MMKLIRYASLAVIFSASWHSTTAAASARSCQSFIDFVGACEYVGGAVYGTTHCYDAGGSMWGEDCEGIGASIHGACEEWCQAGEKTDETSGNTCVCNPCAEWQSDDWPNGSCWPSE